MNKSSDMYKQIVKAQKAMKSWPEELTHDLVIIPVEDFSCKDCLAVQEAEQNPNTECDVCGWNQ